METLTHIISGSIALSTGTLALIFKKGSERHKVSGKVFVLSMIIMLLTGFYLSLTRHNMFLFFISGFCSYMFLNGVRSFNRKYECYETKWLDKLIFGVFLIFNVGLTVYGILNTNHFIGIVAIVFGAIGLVYNFWDLKLILRFKKSKNEWLLSHIRGMIGAMIALITAFFSVNIDFLPPLIIWLSPTIILTPLIIYWTNKVS